MLLDNHLIQSLILDVLDQLSLRLHIITLESI